MQELESLLSLNGFLTTQAKINWAYVSLKKGVIQIDEKKQRNAYRFFYCFIFTP
ncbi:hypothetical protein N9L20_00720 [Flavobacteriaceae bacterium]|nr:hypothetical protein [Flavobacteriaceae bacterium]